MRAVLMERGRIWVESVPDPEPRKHEVLVKSIACGICGSDLHAQQHTEDFVSASQSGGGTFQLATFDPVVLGHEFCAEVVDYGAGTTKRPFKTGQPVCSVPVIWRNQENVPVGFSNEVPGGFGEYMVLSSTLLIPVPDGLPATSAALTEPLAVACHAVEKAHPSKDETIVIVGGGPVGLAILAQLKHRGLGPVIVSEPSEQRRSLAESLGANVLANPNLTDVWQLPEIGKAAAVLVFECVGAPRIIDHIYESVPHGARVVIVGVCMQTDSVNHLPAINKELNVQYVLGYSLEEFEESLKLIEDGTVEVASMITGSIGLDEVPGMFDVLRQPCAHCKVMVEPWK